MMIIGDRAEIAAYDTSFLCRHLNGSSIRFCFYK